MFGLIRCRLTRSIGEQASICEVVNEDDGVCLIRLSDETEVHAPRVAVSKGELQRRVIIVAHTST